MESTTEQLTPLGSPELSKQPLSIIDISRLEQLSEMETEDGKWVRRELPGFAYLTRYIDPVTDSRLARPIVEEDQTAEPFHRALQPDSEMDGSSISWALTPSDESKADFDRYRETLRGALLESEDGQMIEQLRELREEIARRAQESLVTIADCFSRDIPEGLRENMGSLIDRMHVFGSGGLAQAALRRLLRPGVPQATTGENGSDYLKQIADEKNAGIGNVEIPIRNADGSLRTPAELVADYRKAIDSGCRFFSVTWIPKTGINLEFVVREVAAFIKAHNEALEHAGDQIVWILDAVQYAGRGDFSKVFEMMQLPFLSAVVLTSSKGFCGIPHVGFPLFTDVGQRQLAVAKEMLGKEQLDVIATECQWSTPAGLPLPTQLRLIDGAQRIEALYEAQQKFGKDLTYGQLARETRDAYRAMFKNAGLRIVDERQVDEKPITASLVLEFPIRVGLTQEGIDAALTYCARYHAMFGGPLRVGEQHTFIRFGIPWTLLARRARGTLTAEVFEEKLAKFQTILEQAIIVGVGASALAVTPK